MCPLNEGCFGPPRVISYSGPRQGLQTHTTNGMSRGPRVRKKPVPGNYYSSNMGFPGLNTCRIMLHHRMEWMDSAGYCSVPPRLACWVDLQLAPRSAVQMADGRHWELQNYMWLSCMYIYVSGKNDLHYFLVKITLGIWVGLLHLKSAL